jgi:hypothetical protein
MASRAGAAALAARRNEAGRRLAPWKKRASASAEYNLARKMQAVEEG